MQGGGRRGGGGGGGGDGGESEPFDFRRWLAAFTQGLGKTARSLGKTLAAILLLASIFYGSHFIKPLAQAAKRGVRWLLRPRWCWVPQGEALPSSIGWVCLSHNCGAKGEDAT